MLNTFFLHVYNSSRPNCMYRCSKYNIRILYLGSHAWNLVLNVIFRRPKTHNFHVNLYANNTFLLGYVWFLLLMYISWSRLCSLMVCIIFKHRRTSQSSGRPIGIFKTSFSPVPTLTLCTYLNIYFTFKLIFYKV